MRQLKDLIQSLAIKLNPPILAMCAFTVPISSSLKSFFFPWAVLNLLWIPAFRQQLKTLLNNRPTKMALILFGIILIGLTYSPANFDEKWTVVSKYLKLLYFPLLLLAFQEEKAKIWAIHGFLLAMIVTCILGVFSHFGYFQQLLPNPDHVFRNHIITGFMIAYAAFLSLRLFFMTNQRLNISASSQERRPAACPRGPESWHHFWISRSSRGTSCVTRWLYLLCLMIFTYQMFFINGGRMSYLIFIMLFTYGCYYHLSRLHAAIAVFVIMSIVGGAYLSSVAFQVRVHDTLTELSLFQKDNANTSLGYRVQFQSFAYQLWQKHPIIGNGTGSFAYYFEELRPVPSWEGGLLEPHNQYWLFAVENGLVGLIALLVFFGLSYQDSLKLKYYGISYRALLYAFLLGNLTDSLLFYSGPGYFFILMSALCLAKVPEAVSK